MAAPAKYLPTKPVILDSGPLGQLCNPSPRRHLEIKLWLANLCALELPVIVPAVVDYEVRRNLMLAGLAASLELLDEIGARVTLLAPSTGVYQSAAGIWAQARRHGRSTSHPLDLDVDVIVAAIAIETGGIVATDNVAHLARFVDARPWYAITPAVLGI